MSSSRQMTLNPYFEAKRMTFPQAIPSGAGYANYFEPPLNYVIIELNKIMQAYLGLED